MTGGAVSSGVGVGTGSCVGACVGAGVSWVSGVGTDVGTGTVLDVGSGVGVEALLPAEIFTRIVDPFWISAPAGVVQEMK